MEQTQVWPAKIEEEEEEEEEKQNVLLYIMKPYKVELSLQ
jgi:hypothetical protein